MFISGADFFLLGPGIAAAGVGLLAMLLLSFGPLVLGPVTLTGHAQALAACLATIGLTCLYMGIIARVANDLTGSSIQRWKSVFTYTRTIATSIALIVTGLLINVLFIGVYFDRGFYVLAQDALISHLAFTGLFLIVIGLLTFGFSLVLHAISERAAKSFAHFPDA
jgi:hypothetical protein